MMSDTFLSPEWFDAYVSRVNADPEMTAIAKWFNASWFLIADQTRKVICVEAGQITNIVHAPRIDTRAVFGFRAPMATWQKFISKKPPPLHNDFFAMLMRVPEFTIEGESLVAMQNARALQRMMNLMREGA
jgi:hypothetical protein